MLFRTEFDVQSHESTVVEQSAYKNEDGDVMVIDAGDPVPDGFHKFTPTVE